jgi:hypothetical protein
MNLIPMASMLPKSSFVGIDLSATQVGQAQSLIQRLGLENIRVSQQDIIDFRADGTFDYVIAHGIYSWVPRNVREKLMDIFRRCLSPNGLGYISFNTWPGSYLRQMTRDMMLYHSRGSASINEKTAKAKEVVSLASSPIQTMQTAYREAIRAMAPEILQKPNSFLAHDELEAVWEPVYLQQFLMHAQQHGLSYIGAAEPAMNLSNVLPRELRQRLQSYSKTTFEVEQYCDFIYGTQYRAAVLSLQNALPSPDGGGANAVKHMFCAARLVEQPEGQLASTNREIRFLNESTNAYLITSEIVLIAVLRQLSANWPKAIEFRELYAIASVNGGGFAVSEDLLAQNLFSAYCISLIELWSRPTTFIAKSPQRPLLTKLARVQAATGGFISTLRHEEFNPAGAHLQNPQLVQKMLPLMDGSRDRQALLDELSGSVFRNEFSTDAVPGITPAPAELSQLIGRLLGALEAESMLSVG